ncbi:Uncharacterised protein [Vibrio cholerae]|nr:Uncharacterised protein [Vibrio cholerae]CSI57040.1 Uncharacterised protein [Vibrio cholerae]
MYIAAVGFTRNGDVGALADPQILHHKNRK